MVRRRDPRELMLLALCLLSGLTYLFGAQPPNSIEAVMPDWLVLAWYFTLALAGGVGIVGNLWPGQIGTALLLRLSGQILAAGPAASFAVAAVAFAGTRALFAAGVTMVWAGVCLWTGKYLAEDLTLLRESG